MSDIWYKHPNRHPKNIDGPFYSLAYGVENLNECHSECLDCELPQAEAPKLIKNLYDDDGDTYFIKQPETSEEIEQAIAAADVCCVEAIRYGGTDLDILRQMRLISDLCDYRVDKHGKVNLKNENI